MIVDTSALSAVFLNEPEAQRCLEAGIVLSHRKGRFMQHVLDLFLTRMSISVIVFDDEHRRVALDAWWRFGKDGPRRD